MKPINQEAVDFLTRQVEGGKALPGQSLTHSPEEPYKWEKPPEFTNLEEATHSLFNTIYSSETAGNILLSINNGVGIIDLTSIILYTGFLEGKWTPDLMLLLAEPTMYMLMALAEKADIPYEFEAGDKYLNDLSPKDQNKRLRDGINYFDSIHQKGTEGVDEQAVSEEVRKKIEEVELPTSLLEKTTTVVDDNSLLVRGEK
jgi:hypothetical protein